MSKEPPRKGVDNLRRRVRTAVNLTLTNPQKPVGPQGLAGFCHSILRFFREWSNALGMKDKIIHFIGQAVFEIRWLLAPMYLLLYVALGVYLVKYAELIFQMFITANSLSDIDCVLIILELVDMSMIANLVVMTTTGGYSIFVREYRAKELDDRPRWLSPDFSSGEQKVKLGASLMAIVAVNMIHDALGHEASWDKLLKTGFILGVFTIVTVAFCYINKLLHSSHAHKRETPNEGH